MSSKPAYQITRYPIGSVREIWTISWPLILGLISDGMMVVMDRLMLGKYSLDAMNSAATASAAAFAIFILPMIVAGISEVFVGRYHGQEKYQKMGSATWQMIWLSIFLIPLFFLLGRVTGPFLFNTLNRPDYALDYFYVFINFGSLFCLNPALMGFFIGQGKVRIITIAIALANVINFGLDYAFIFGTRYTPSFGVKGAAYATIIAQFFLALVFFIAFLSKKNRKEKGTMNWKLKKKLFVNSLKIGVPASFAHLSEYTSYFFFLKLMGRLGGNFLTVSVLINNAYMILYFIIEGMSKGVTAVCSNLIGVKKYEYVKRNLFSATKLHLAFFVVFTTLFLVGSSDVYSLFIGKKDLALLEDPSFVFQMSVASIYLCVFYLFDGIVWLFVGMLTAASDTKFIMKIGTFAPWVLFLLPIYLYTKFFNASPLDVWLIAAVYPALHLSIYLFRYRSGIWRKDYLEKDPSLPLEEN